MNADSFSTSDLIEKCVHICLLAAPETETLVETSGMNARAPHYLAAELYEQKIFSRAELRERGFSGRAVTDAVAVGRLRRLRRDHYAAADLHPDIAEAVRIGGRLSCLSLLRMIGVFVLECVSLHVHIAPGTARLRPRERSTTILHWSGWSEDRSRRHIVPLRDAVMQAVRCQTPRAAVATLDSVVHHGLMSMTDLAVLFTALPQRYGALLSLVDPSAGSGPETFMRLLLRTLGVSFETQVSIAGVGIVDFVVDGWLIIECDSKEFHESWKQHLKDRHRDMAAASLGYVTIRPVASEILYDGAAVSARVRAILATMGPRFVDRRS